MERHLVVSRFKEDFFWLAQAKVDRIHLYNKSGQLLRFAGSKTVAHEMENVGRESFVYCTHIVENYDSLPEILIFCQAKPFDHYANFMAAIAKPTIAEMGAVLQDGRNVLVSEDLVFFGHIWPHYIDSNEWTKDTLAAVWEKFFDGPVPVLVSSWGAMFAVKREIIRKRPLRFWSDLTEMHHHYERLPWALEHLWPRILRPKSHL